MTAVRARPRRPRPRVSLLLALVTAAGLLLAVFVAPLVVAVGLTVKGTANHFQALPTDLPDPVVGLDSRILAADGSVVAVLHGTQNRIPVTIGQVPPVMQQAIIDIEDSRFYSHHGVDYRGLAQAAVTNASAGGVQQGGSTLTQQYVKNVLLDAASTPDRQQAATGKSLTRKLRGPATPWRSSSVGPSGASSRATSTSPTSATTPTASAPPRSATSVSPSPHSPSPRPPCSPGWSKARRPMTRCVTRKPPPPAARRSWPGCVNWVISPPRQESAARATPLGLHPTLPPAAGDPCLSSPAPFFCDYVRQSLLGDPALGATRAQRDQRLLAGGLTIKTSFDPAVQRAAQHGVDGVVDKNNRAAATEVIVKPGTGDVLAMAVNRDYGTGPGQTTIPLPTQAAFGPGSAFKVFTLAAALAQGLPLSTSFFAPACYVSTTFTIGTNSGRNPNDPNATCSNGFSNADPAEAATYSIPKATWLSVNTFYIQLEEQVGVLHVAAMARTLGIPRSRLDNVGPNDGSLTLGTKVVSPLDMATAYATLAATAPAATPDRSPPSPPMPASPSRSPAQPPAARPWIRQWPTRSPASWKA